MSEQPGGEPEDRLLVLGRAIARAVRETEDQDDIADADAAWEEPGESIPLEELEAEFGRS
jgi:hypothetical protein